VKLPLSSVENQFAGRNWPKFALLIFYAAVTSFACLTHAMWRDELQAWLVARDSTDLSALFHNLHYEGHAALWYLLLMPLTRLSHHPVLMQLLHVAIATATVALVLWRAPLSTLEQVLFPFGYFFFYEYAVKSLAYALGCFIVFLFCTLWHRRRQSPVIMALVLALMANVDILFMILSIAAVAALAVDRLVNKPPTGEAKAAGWQSDLMALGIVGAGWALAIATAFPPSDSGYAVGWFFEWSWPRFGHTLETLRMLFVPRSIWAYLGAGAVLCLTFARSRANPPAAVFLAVSLLGLLSFFYTKYLGFNWHHGMVFIAFLATVWIDRTTQDPAVKPSRQNLVPGIVFGAILAFQVIAGVRAVWLDLHHPLSRGRDVARFIETQGWAADPIISGIPDFATVTVVGYLGVERAYYLEGRRWGSFTIWDQRRLHPVNVDQALAETTPLVPTATWIADPANSDPALLRKYGFVEVAQFSGATMENYAVYRRKPGIIP
jgi:hypothetical protein